MPGLRATEEQRVAVEKFRAGTPLKIAAFAGAGKTTTLRMLAESRRSRGAYLAFNKSIATEAKEKFPNSVDCRTTHSIAFRAIMPSYGSMPKMTKSMLAKQLSEVAGYKPRSFQGAIRLNGVHQAHLVLGTVRQFCQSADPAFALSHVPTYGRLLGASDEVVAEVRNWAVAEGRELWSRMTDRRDDVPLGHDGYLKLWALGRPQLPAEYVLLDEAQDTNAVVLGVLREQRGQIVYVGDRHQQIYEWRGAINAMELVQGCDEAALTQSFRFGPEIAQAASNVLATLGEMRTIRGNPAVKSAIVPYGTARTVLARTNATVILQVLEAINAGQRPAVVGGTKELKRLLSDVYELKAGKPGVCPEFFGFEKWAEVVEFADTEEGESIRMFVQLVEQHGEGKLWAAVSSAEDDEAAADVILSTAHKAKGREWDSVRLAPDFANSRLGSHPDAPSEVRLFYVAMTRAKKTLIVAPEVLHTFATDAWKTKEPEKAKPRAQPRRTAPRPAPPPQPAPAAEQPAAAQQHPRPVREIEAPGARARHPGAAPASPRRPVQTPRTPQRQQEPARPEAASTAPPRQRPPERPGLWGRIARLFT
jgi:hypothetical protein